jgi:glycosyltransferase involved in cell wall biosynthesis
MPDEKPSICLCMIVKNEAPVIRRCLDSVRPLIDHWVIVDTGSTDGTQDIIRAHMADLPGTLHDRPWVDFAHNRSESLALARPHADYSLVIDADDFLEPVDGSSVHELTQDCYTLDIIDTPLRYPRKQLVHNRLAWRYRSALHEFIDCEQAHSVGHLPWLMRRNHDGARRRDGSTYIKDAQILSRALETEQDPFLRARYTFYLAQSFRDCQQFKLAIARYQERAKMGGWQEEVFYSLYQVAKLKERLERPDEEVLAAYEAASQSSVTRMEALHGASRYCRIKGRYAQGYDLAQRGLGRPYPPEALFGEPSVYETGLLDEFAVNAYWTDRHIECLDACLKILHTEKFSGADLRRVVSNAQFSLQKIQAATQAQGVKGI